MLTLFIACILAAAVARLGVLLKSNAKLSRQQLVGAFVVAGAWGYIVACAALMLRPEWSPYAVGAAAAFSGYLGDLSMFTLAKALLKKATGLDLDKLLDDTARSGDASGAAA